MSRLSTHARDPQSSNKIEDARSSLSSPIDRFTHISSESDDSHKMSRSLASRRFTTQSLFTSKPLAFSQSQRCFSQTTSRCEERRTSDSGRGVVPPKRAATESLLQNLYGPSRTAPAKPNAMESLSQSIVFDTINRTNIDTSALSGQSATPVTEKEDHLEPFHLHIFAHKHNTHVTLTRPNRNPVISLSCGNIGYKKSRRGLYDSAYQLSKYVFERLIHMGWEPKINRLEVVMRGFGQGRDASIKALMSPEGKFFREKIVRVSDSSRIKFAGTRSKKPRRL